MRHVAITTSVALAAVLAAGCSSSSTQQAEAPSASVQPTASAPVASASPTASASPSASPSPTGPMTVEQAGNYYLDWICWSNRSSEWIGKAARGKSNSQLLSDSFKAKARRAAKIRRDTALALDAPPQAWPDDVAKPISGVVDGLLSEVSGLNQLVDAKTSTDVAYAWRDYAKGNNTSAQKVRLRLGLPSANSQVDGCERRGDDPRSTATPSASS